MGLQSTIRRVWPTLASAASAGKTFRRMPGESEPHIAANTAIRKPHPSLPDLAVKTTDPLVRLLALASRGLLP